MASDEQAKERALDLLRGIAERRRASVEDVRLRALLTSDLVEEVFEIAWRHQWDSDFSGFKREIRPTVESVVAEAVESDAD